MLRDVDVLVIDLQDVGTRVYTYIYTMANCMRAAARHGVRVVVCDRPNPVGGVAVEGAMLRPEYASFVGQFPIPLRHGLTIGEIARLFNQEFAHRRRARHRPARRLDARHVLRRRPGCPGSSRRRTCRRSTARSSIRARCCSRARCSRRGAGTTRPFELIGAPWIDGESLAAAMNARGLAGVHFRPAFFEPTFQKHAKQTCGGCQLHVTDRQAFQPVRAAVELIDEFRRQNPSAFAWRQPPYEYEHEKWPIDILFGSDRLRTAIDRGEGVGALVASWAEDEEAFRRTARTVFDVLSRGLAAHPAGSGPRLPRTDASGKCEKCDGY